MSEPEGFITDIKRCAVHDGPGIRTTVFLKGCPMRCKWCHNPETLNASNALMFFPRLCISCGACAGACPTGAARFTDGAVTFDRTLCTACGKCVPVCPADARRLAGRYVSLSELLEEVMRDSPFYRTSGGGVTLSGGEPLMQPAFTSAFFRACKQGGLHTALDTSGQGRGADLEQILDFTDLVLFDLKVMDTALHKRLTGIGNEEILSNLRLVDSSRVPIVVRAPLVLDFDAELENLHRIVDLVSSLQGVVGVELLPAHNMAQHKYEALGIPCEFSAPAYTDEQRRQLDDLVSRVGPQVDNSGASDR